MRLSLSAFVLYFSIATVLTGFFLYIVVRGILVWRKRREPGYPLDRTGFPRLWQAADEIAGRIDTRPVDAIYMVPDPTIHVTEEGSLIAKLRDRGRRCLVLGLAALPGAGPGRPAWCWAWPPCPA